MSCSYDTEISSGNSRKTDGNTSISSITVFSNVLCSVNCKNICSHALCCFHNVIHNVVADLSIIYRYFHGHCLQETRDIIPVPLKRVRSTRGSTHSHPFQVSLPNPRTLSHESSFTPRTCNLRNVLPPSCLPEFCNLPSFRSKINKRDLIFLSS